MKRSVDVPGDASPDFRANLGDVRHRADKAMRHIADLCNGRRRWTMTIPVDTMRDDDVVFADVVTDVRHLAAELDRLRAERDHYRAWIEAMLDDHHLWRNQGEDRLRWNVRTTLRGALDGGDA